MTRPSTPKTLAIAIAALTPVLVTSCTPPPSTPEELEVVLSDFILRPDRTCEQLRVDFGLEFLPLVDYPDEVGMPFEEQWLPTPDGEELRLWYIPAEQNLGTVILSNGTVGEIPCYLFLTLILHENGWSVVMYDYRGFGQSTGVPTLGALLPDLEVVLDWTLARINHEQVTLYGQSLGSIPSVALAVARPEAVNAVILDSPVALGAEIAYYDQVLRGKAGAVTAALDPALITESIISQMHQPLLVYEHEQDTLTPAETVELLFNRAGGLKQIVRFPCFDHFRGLFYGTDVYAYYLHTFLTQVWSGEPPRSLVPAIIEQYRQAALNGSASGEASP